MSDHQLLAHLFNKTAELRCSDESSQPGYVTALAGDIESLRHEILSRMNGHSDNAKILDQLVGPVADSLNDMGPESDEVRNLRLRLTPQILERMTSSEMQLA